MAKDGLRQNRCRGRSVAGNIIGLGRCFLQKLLIFSRPASDALPILGADKEMMRCEATTFDFLRPTDRLFLSYTLAV